MKHLKRFESKDLVDLYNDIFNTTIKESFLEFEDNGWYWNVVTTGGTTTLSHEKFPRFKYFMTFTDRNKSTWVELQRCDINCSGTIYLDGDIKWRTYVFTDQRHSNKITEGPIFEEFNDFIVAIKRIASDIGRFQFSYDNIYGYKRIIIEGKI